MAESNGTAANGQAAPSPEVKALQEAQAVQKAKNDLLTAQKAGVELERQLATASVTGGSQTPLTGNTTVTDAGHLAKLVAYHSLRKAAAKAAEQINQVLTDATEKPSILIVDKLNLLEQHALLQAVQTQLASAAASVQAQVKANEALKPPTKQPEVQPPPPPAEGGEGGEIGQLIVATPHEEAALALPAMAGAGLLLGNVTTAITALSGAVGAAAGVAAWFRNEYTITGQSVEIQQNTAKLLMASALKGRKVFLAGFQPTVNSDLLGALEALVKDIHTLIQSTASLAGRASQLDPGELKTAMNTMLSVSKTLLETINTLVDGLLAQPAVGAESKLMRALVAEQMSKGAVACSHYLYVQVEASGGQAVTEKSLWHSGRVTYAGGGVLSYLLTDRTGCVVAADALPMFSTMTMRNGKEATAVEDVPLPQ